MRNLLRFSAIIQNMSYWYGIYGKVLWKQHNRIVEIQSGIHNKIFQEPSGIEYEASSVKILDTIDGCVWVPLSQLEQIDSSTLDCADAG